MHRYGELPVSLGIHQVKCEEMMFYQYMPIKLSGQTGISVEKRLLIFDCLIGAASCDFIGVFGLNKFIESNVYITAKHMFQLPGCSFNREGWHSDGFMTDDIQYSWASNTPTIFNNSDFNLTNDHSTSMNEMTQQALEENNYAFRNNELIRMNQYNIHKVNDVAFPRMRTFFRLSFSPDQYNLKGNAINPHIDYNWKMQDRQIERNNPAGK